MDNVLLSLSEWIKSIIKDTITRLVEIEKDSDHYPELMDVNTTCDFLGIKYATFSDNYRYLKDFQRNYLVRNGQKEPSKNGSLIKYNNFTKRLLDKVLAKLFDYIIAQKEDKKHE